MRTHQAEILVIGSGAGGAPTAATLAEAGHDVLIVEEGPYVAQGELTPFSLQQMEQQYRSAGLTAALGRPTISYAEGRCAGGGTEINSGLYRRPSEETIIRWRSEYGLREFETADLEPIFEEVETTLEVQATPPQAMNPASEKMSLGARRLGWAQVETPRWIRYEHGQLKRRSMTETYLPRAFAAGAQMLVEHRVERIETTKAAGGLRRATAAIGTDRFGQPVRFEFDRVIVCGGAIHTPALLQRSGFRRNIGGGLAVHPTVKLAARFDDPVNVADDVPVHQVMEFAPELSFGGSASHPGLVALALADNWELMRQTVTEWPEMAVYYAAIKSEGRGRVTALPGMRDPVVTYRLTARDKHLLAQGLGRLSLMMLEAGALEVYPSVVGAPIVRTRADLGQAAESLRADRASVMTVHICSTVPMGETATSPVDSFGRLKAATNIGVNDASLLPDAPGVNPQALVTTIALRNARHWAATNPGDGQR